MPGKNEGAGGDHGASRGANTTILPPVVTLPKGGGAIRGIGEKFATNPVTGTASVTVPVFTSPGRSGFGPQLSLNYDSGAGNGPFGFGWSLELPAVTRKTEKGLPQYRDAEDSDVFILSGAEDLVPVPLSPGEEPLERTIGGVGFAVRRYRPRIEGLFARIERWTNQIDGEIHWRSITKDNINTLYGRTAESRIADPDDAHHVFSWLICQSYDDKGNAITYSYVAENSTNVDLAQAQESHRGDANSPLRGAQRYVKRIRYGNPTANRDANWIATDPSLLSDADWMFEVVFDYEEGHYQEQQPDTDGSVVAQATIDLPSGFSWPVREDPFSSYRAGFEIRTYRLCRRVLMFHHFPAELQTDDCLVRSTDFTYNQSPIASLITETAQSGYVRRPNGTYLKKSLPPLAFEYSRAIVSEDIQVVDSDSLDTPPVGADGQHWQWLDLDGEGLQGLLSEQQGGWYYKRNLSPISVGEKDGQETVVARFEALAQVTTHPSTTEGINARHQFLDLAGDGQLDLVQFEKPVPGFFERTMDERWDGFVPFGSLPNISWSDANLKFLDLTGDGHADILITEDNVLTWYPSLAEEGFATALRIPKPYDEDKGPAIVFGDSTQAIFVADMSGDGLTDIVRIRNGEVCYWPNLGYGRFGSKVTMDNAPWFEAADLFDQRRLRLADIDGSGVTDLIYLHADGVRLFFNRSGNGWSDARTLAVFPHVDSLASIQPVDLLGNGTACLVWTSPLPGDTSQPMRYIDLMGGREPGLTTTGQKPHLLIKTVNNLGAETVVQYAPSTKFYLRDKRAGKPWITRLPFPVHCVERVETYDRVSGNRSVSRYEYHHGDFDGIEREFRGFGMVEQWDTEEIGSTPDEHASSAATNLDDVSFVPPIHTKTWFHTGVSIKSQEVSRHLATEYYGAPDKSDATVFEAFLETLLDDTVLPTELNPDEERQACRALKGAMLRQEVYADDASAGASEEVIKRAGTPYTVTEQNFTIERLQPQGTNRHAVFFSHAREALNYHYERSPNDPRISHAMTLEVDKYGNVLKAVAIGYGRAQSPLSQPADRQKQTQTLITFTESKVTNDIADEAHPDDYRAPLPSEVLSYELTGYKLADGAARFQIADFVEPDPNDPEGRTQLLKFDTEVKYEESATQNPQRRVIEHVRTLYRRNDLTGLLKLGDLEAFALPGESHRLAFTPGLLTQAYKRALGGGPEEQVLPVLAPVLGGVGSDQGGYRSSQVLRGEGFFPTSIGEPLWTQGDEDDHWWMPSGQVFYSTNADSGDPAATAAGELVEARQHFFLPRKFTGPFTHSSTVDYDVHDLLVVKTEDAVQNTVTALNDYRVLQPKGMTDANGNQSRTAFDALGMVAGTAVMGKAGEPHRGDSLDTFTTDLTPAQITAYFDAQNPRPLAVGHLGTATTRIIYDLDRVPACAASVARETHVSDLTQGEQTNVHLTFVYSDGFGREAQTKIQAEPGPLDPNDSTSPILDPRWVSTGLKFYNNKGKPVRQYEPFFSPTHHFGIEQHGVSSTLFYDPAERVVATLHPNHTYEKVVFDPWQQTTYDVNDTVLSANGLTDPKTDDDVAAFFSRLPSSDYLPTWYQQRVALPANDPERVAADKTAIHRQTPMVAHLDTLGRTFLTIAHNRFERNNAIVEEEHPTRVDLDIEGNQRVVRDAVVQNGGLGRIVVLYDYDMLGNRIHQASMEAGERWMLNDVTGKPIRAWDSRDFTRRMTYDDLRRPTGLFVMENGIERLAERTVYGESQGAANNHRTRVFQVFDGAGIVSNEAYDFKGNLQRTKRDLVPDYKGEIDWQLNPAANDGSFTSSTTYDALNRPTALTAPDGSTYVPTYNEANLLDSVEVNLRGLKDANEDPVWTPFVTNIDYNAKGQRTIIHYANGATTTYEDDDRTFRLVRLRTTRTAPQNDLASQIFSDAATVQDLRYTYDASANITRIEDNALLTTFNNGEVRPVSDYTYDATYRLIEATGREHIGQSVLDFQFPGGNLRDRPFVGLNAHPNDLQAIRSYAERYEYDAVGNFDVVHHIANGGSWARTYEYDADSLIEPAKKSNRLTRTTVGDGTSFVENYIYVDEQGRDVHGCMTAINAMTMVWDFEDQLQKVDLGGGGTAYYVYNASGERERKVIETQGGIRKQERIYMGGYEIYREYNGNGTNVTLQRETLHVMDDKQRIALVETKTHESGSQISNPQPLVRYQLGNHLESASLELDQGGGLISYEEYHPYGTTAYQAMHGAAEVSLKRYRYTGKERDEETGLYYHGARYYAPWLGRWTSCDPAWLVDGTNFYVYTRSSPLNFTDLSGRDTDPSQQESYSFQPTYNLAEAVPEPEATRDRPVPRILIKRDQSSSVGAYVPLSDPEAGPARLGLNLTRVSPEELARDEEEYRNKSGYNAPETPTPTSELVSTSLGILASAGSAGTTAIQIAADVAQIGRVSLLTPFGGFQSLGKVYDVLARSERLAAMSSLIGQTSSTAGKVIGGVAKGANTIGVGVGLYNLITASGTSEKVQGVADALASAIGFVGPYGAAFSGGYSLGQLGDQGIRYVTEKTIGKDLSPSEGLGRFFTFLDKLVSEPILGNDPLDPNYRSIGWKIGAWFTTTSH